MLTAAAVVGMALGIRTWALNSIAGVYTDHAAYVSVAHLDDQTLSQAIEIALADPQVQAQLTTTQPTPDAPWLNYTHGLVCRRNPDESACWCRPWTLHSNAV